MYAERMPTLVHSLGMIYLSFKCKTLRTVEWTSIHPSPQNS